ncbi:PAAR domain-containing protein [Stenotrophomonas maltophilia]|nr:PAAR domain-containing protein [Stenotrophomonas maltophilia]
MSRMLIVVGDALQTGGSVLTGSPHTDIEGRAVARVGDRVMCARHGPGSIVTGDSTLVIDGQPVARDGDKASCGCALMAGKQQRAHVVAGGAGGGGQATLGALVKVAGIVAPLLKTMPLQTPPFAPPGTPASEEPVAPQCWVDDHDTRIDRDVDGRYYEAYDVNGDKHDYAFPVSYRIEIPLHAQGEVVVSIKVQPMPQAGVTAAEVTATRARMEQGIDQFWNGRFTLDIHDPQFPAPLRSALGAGRQRLQTDHPPQLRPRAGRVSGYRRLGINNAVDLRPRVRPYAGRARRVFLQ